MMMSRWTWIKTLRTLCALLFLSLGLGHQPVQATAPLEAYGEQYRLPDGSFADICAEGHEEHDPVAAPVCEVCRLASSTDLPPPVVGISLPAGRASVDNPLRVAAQSLGFTALARPMSRGPPQKV